MNNNVDGMDGRIEMEMKILPKSQSDANQMFKSSKVQVGKDRLEPNEDRLLLEIYHEFLLDNRRISGTQINLEDIYEKL